MGQSACRVIAVAAVIALSASCTERNSTTPGLPPPVIDLTRELNRAEKAPATLNVRVDHVAVAGDVRPAIRATVPHRLIFTTRIPTRAVLTVSVGVPGPGGGPVRVVVWISDGRGYEILHDQRWDPATHATWQSLAFDLSHYAGWQWSLFYHPSRRPWQIAFSAYPASSGPPFDVAWAEPLVRGH